MNIMYLIPKNLLSFWVGVLVHLQLPYPLSYLSIWLFAKAYHIEVEEAEKTLKDYKSVGDFFTRKLKVGVRPIASGIYVHPTDSKLTSRGHVFSDEILQAKGKTYKISEMLEDKYWQRFKGGSYLTYYLCPTDYHRVHSPVDGEIREVRYVPGNLWPVNDWSVQNIDRLFAVNERVILDIYTERGPLSLVFVGATNVGSIRLAFEPDFKTNHQHVRSASTIKYSKPVTIKKGDELGMFAMGSTVVIVAGPEFRELGTLVSQQSPIPTKVGQAIE